MKSLLKKLLAVTMLVVISARMEDCGLVVSVRPRKGRMRRCPVCGRRCPGYDSRGVPRRWRALDLGQTKAFLEYAIVRVECPEHGVHPEDVPWARPASRFTMPFESQVAWLAVHASRSVVAQLMRVDWQTVGAICARVYARLDAEAGCRFDGLARIGIDETSYKRGHKYMTVVLDHDRNTVVWAAKGHGRAVLESFFDLLTDEQRASIEVVTADGASWIADVVAKRCPNAERVMDPFHVVGWATDALDEVRRQAWRDARVSEKAAPRRGRGRPRKGEEPPRSRAKAVRGSRFSLLKNPEDLTPAQSRQLEAVAREDPRLYRAYLLKEGLRDVLRAGSGEEAKSLLDAWLARACRCRIPAFVEVSRKVRRRREAIVRAVTLGISNARVEAVNNKIKLYVRMAYGFRNIDNLISLVMLGCSDLPLSLPGREA